MNALDVACAQRGAASPASCTDMFGEAEAHRTASRNSPTVQEHWRQTRLRRQQPGREPNGDPKLGWSPARAPLRATATTSASAGAKRSPSSA